ncbi:hypothetical protein, variant [Aphanomyces invadans]|uniref:RWD domain-containing protein n=1 Tax=Aphanomyces invadans TaxID=157072 RepID=A0A024UN04_9STRA|nr:hypothetical protein, variant [Aphanomyces invadans]ETW07826.1 hypothetical protein, variant [Aphanomyces invadans]|eukprot:XP_008863919.1 hypothetical protein, variant [Aphanomyces invadans]
MKDNNMAATDSEVRANLESQHDEVEALQAIFEHDFEWADQEIYGTQGKSFYVLIPGDYCLRLLIHLPSDYPSRSPPIAEVYDSFGVSSSECDAIIQDLTKTFNKSRGDVCLYDWIESVREKFGSFASVEAASLEAVDIDANELLARPATSHDIAPFLRGIKTGTPITDRKSTFQANAVAVTSVDEVRAFVAHLLEDRKIARATHNMLAYRIVKDVVIKDSDDDGEGGAGSKLSHLLEMTQAQNAVVVSRWYGGIQLGPDRFKHIANCARDVLETHGFIPRKTKTKA